MASLVLAEHDHRTLSDSTARTVTAARQLGEPVDVLVAGEGCEGVAEEAAMLAGVETVLFADDPLYAHPLAEPLTALMLRFAERYDAFLAPATAIGKAVMPRLAAVIDCQQISEIAKVLAPDLFQRPIYAGALIETVQAPPGKKVLTVRTTGFVPATGGGGALITKIVAGPDPALSFFVNRSREPSGRPDLASAKIVVAGGRGLQCSDNAALLARIAARLGAALGASRGAVDAGYLPNECQVGQTGKAVAPELYLAAGISGAVQHVAGMKEAKIIVAINRDEEAPIFKIADFALVADLFQVLPELDEELERNPKSLPRT
jgi:electron transfer flavoprotein alpha subunit